MSADLIDLYYLSYKHLGIYSALTEESHGVIIGRVNYALTSIRMLEFTLEIFRILSYLYCKQQGSIYLLMEDISHVLI